MAAGYTKITYSGIAIQHCHTKRFSQEPVFDQSDSDLSHFKFVVHVSGLVSGVTATSHFQGAGFTGEAAGTMVNIRRALSSPRGSFRMQMGVTADSDGTTILSADPYQAESATPGSGLDVNNGPKCRVIDITHIAANEVFRVEVEFEICLRECNGTIAGEAAAVLSNKWSVTDDVDENLWTTRVYQGVLRTVSAQFNANSFRALVVPPLQPGLRRKRMTFDVSRDGLTLGYTILDEEVNYSAPHPATNWSFRHTETTQTAALMESRVSIMMEGPRTAPRRDLIMLCVAFAVLKIGQGRDKKIKNLFNFLSLSEESGSSGTNRVHLDLAATQSVVIDVKNAPVGVEAVVAFGGLKERFGGTVDAKSFNNLVANYNPDKSIGGRDGENPVVQGAVSRYGAFVTYLQCPCCERHDMAFDPSTVLAVESPSQNPTESTFNVVETVEDVPLPSYISDSHAEAIYTFWQLDSTYDTDEGLVALPVAGSVVAGTSQQQAEARDSVRVISLHPPICTRSIRLAGERAGKRPELPKMATFTDSAGIKHTRLRRIVKPATSTRTADGQELFRVDAEYEFALSRPPADGDEMEIGSNPWDTLGIQKANIGGNEDARTTTLPDGQA